ncbi:hypothetical protein QO010_003374 [Caulobacter ginsengisoli]|uniref:MobA/VirD2-like nuclease domain-containing protein n=1 Tax=Caulobacter ginsengisoli TaxID=400775 RepID=A0ABU0IW27_9CAUL|nr:relaxase/mobilization nuclease domain-containing protein [Caulobacter ginsengisoli]MDQ0465585.1 hypothetical protein [Caulobacter ginsengisoli]
MILKGSQRGSAKQLGAHLLKTTENEHVEVHEVRGFIAEDVMGAMHEAQAVAKGTKCRQHLFSVSLSPPETECVRVETFEHALSKIEERTGLGGQPRIVVFHEKEGRRHCHAVWSRINAETMTAVPLPFFKMRLREVSREIYLENGWQMPRGMMDSKARDPRNFDLAEWQHCKRIGRNARDLKSIMQECWAASDSGASFSKALEERGLYLARGDRRGHVALTYEGEVLSVARYVGKKTKEIAARLGPAESLRDVEATRMRIAEVIAPKLRGLLGEVETTRQLEAARLDQQRQAMRTQHASERKRLDEGQRARSEAEGRARAERMRSGLAGLWDKLRGEHAKLRKQNELEAFMALQRDRVQRGTLVTAQLQDRQQLQAEIRQARQRHTLRVTELHRDLARQQVPQPERPTTLSERFERMAERQTPLSRLDRLREPRQRNERGPELER